MENNSRIKIRLTDNICIIQPEKHFRETVTNSMSFDISKSDNGEPINDNIEISMQSIFLSEKKKATETNSHINITPSKLLPETPTFKAENDKLLLNQLTLCPNSFNSTISSTKNSGGNSIKNTKVSLTKQVISLKNNRATVASPFKSISNTHLNNYSISNDNNKGTLKPKEDNEKRKKFIDNFINKIVKQRNLSSRIVRPSSTILQSAISIKLGKENQTIAVKANKIKGKTAINSNQSKSYSQNNQSLFNQVNVRVSNDRKRKVNFSPSSMTLTKKIGNGNSSNVLPQGNTFSFVNFIIRSCFIKNKTSHSNTNANQNRHNNKENNKNNNTNSSNNYNSSRNRINIPLCKKVRSSPSPPQIGGMKLMITTNKIEEENKQKQRQTISNFSKYMKRSKDNNRHIINSNNKRNNVHMNKNSINSLHVSCKKSQWNNQGNVVNYYSSTNNNRAKA